MSYRQRIQKILDIIEGQLNEVIDIEGLVSMACMSRSTFYRVFYYLVGDSIYSYIKKRRLTEAAIELIDTDKKIIDIAMDYCYETPEAFSRAFKARFQKSPTDFRKKGGRKNLYRRINIMTETATEIYEHKEDENFEVLAKMRLASCHVIGKNPETRSREELIKWAKKKGIPWEIGKARHFGFDNPDICDPANENKPHGYESWMTVPKGIPGDRSIKILDFSGGLYATLETRVGDINQAWKRLATLRDAGKYDYGNHQWLEEVLAFDFKDEMNIRIKIMMPIKSRS